MIIDKATHSLEDKVFLELEELVLSGELKRGDILTETALSERLGVSRTPVRSALHRLSEEGLISTEANRRAVVVGIGKEELVDIYRIRMRLEGLASAMAARRISEEDLGALREAVELSEFYISKNNTEKLGELDSRFHLIIYRASGSRLLTKILGELHRNTKLYRRHSLSVPGRLEKSSAEHREILAAIENRDEAAAERLTEAHIGAAIDNILNGIQ
ncbi:MAG: GntR family transcriptional regulator [Clostridia bacterium]|nr:GntR family transcriptional regulator [Clostridia bacterium]MBQ8720101.1 GntR family transcriptional regulator [Clostridia bacterium]